jgi:hypothetical protein
MKVEKAIELVRELSDTSTMLRNFIHETRNDDVRLQKVMDAFGITNYVLMEKRLKTLLEAAEMTASRLTDVISKIDMDI